MPILLGAARDEPRVRGLRSRAREPAARHSHPAAPASQRCGRRLDLDAGQGARSAPARPGARSSGSRCASRSALLGFIAPVWSRRDRRCADHRAVHERVRRRRTRRRAAPAATEAVCVAGGARCSCSPRTLIEGLAWVHGALARALLGPSSSEELARLAARIGAADARADLARELHDSVGHSVTAAVLQASAARRVLATDPAFVDGALAAIEAQGRDALDELDRVLAVLRDEQRRDARPRPRSPTSTALLARTRAAGQPSSRSRAAATSSACPPSSAARPTACCRRRSRTSCATPRARRRRSRSRSASSDARD